jgi:hypothetical protein
MEAKIRNGKITISIPMQTPKPSASGKTLVVATSRGRQVTSLKIDGKAVYVIANVLVDKDEEPHPGARRRVGKPPASDAAKKLPVDEIEED